MSEPFVRALLELFRELGLFERDAICCGTVTVQQCFALQILLEGPCDNSALAERTGVAASSTTRLVDGMKRHGWVERTQDPDDRRHILIALTPAGRKQAKRLRDLTENRVGALLEAIPARKRAQVVESVELIRDALRRA